ncbi:hypothetical protein CCAX7_19660 [Capsulimonas corticalis]|uniref:Uncharacterized protein n=1 Tax=Capsulimonas corticalis TaxID=2219043 RepID=A0A402D2P5_9BACT|nr:hypothetical protein CCAX7_19660 [Capsulimonas corticalis]
MCLYKLSTYVRNSEQSPFSHEEPVPGIWEEVCLRDSPNSTLPFSFPPANEIYVVTHETRNSQPVVVVKSKEDIEYLVFREYSNRALSELMTEVSLKRTSYGFEKRYSFSGTAHDTVRDWVLQKR